MDVMISCLRAWPSLYPGSTAACLPVTSHSIGNCCQAKVWSGTQMNERGQTMAINCSGCSNDAVRGATCDHNVYYLEALRYR